MVWKPTGVMVAISAVGTVYGGAIIMKEYAGGAKFDSPISAAGKTFVITGANTGIGKETARDLAKRGGKVIMACRDLIKCEEARKEIVLETQNKFVYCRECDLASFNSIRQFANQIEKEEPRLDVLINNAGVMRCPRSVTKEGIETQLGVNHMGHFLLTNLLLGKLKATEGSRIVNVSSVAHTRGKMNWDDLNSDKHYDPSDAYNQSKLANVLFTRELAKRVQGTGVTVNAVHPGIVDTEIARHMSFTQSTFSKIFLKPLVWPFIKTPRQGAQTVLYAALDEGLKDTSGQYFSNCTAIDVSDKGKDEDAARRLWLISEKWTRLS